MSEDAKGNLKLLLVLLVSFTSGFLFSGSALNSVIVGLLTLGVMFSLLAVSSLEDDVFAAMKSRSDAREIEDERLFSALRALDERLSRIEKK